MPRRSAAICVPGPMISHVTIGSFRKAWMCEENSPARIQGVAPGDSIWSPRLSCSVRKDATCENPPPSATAPMITAETRAPGSTTLRHGRRTAKNIDSSRAPGATLTHAAAVSSDDAMRGWLRAIASATTITGATTPSRRPIAIGPSSSRNASHHHAPSVVPPPRGRSGRGTRSRNTSATASRIVTIRAQPTAYGDPPPVPKGAAASIGRIAPAG